MGLLDNDTFLTELTKLFLSKRSQGSVTFTMKMYDGHDKPKPRKDPLPEPTEYKCLVRAKSNNKKISTVINPRDVNKFQLAYCTLLRGNLDGLKKLKKSKPKSKATQ